MNGEEFKPKPGQVDYTNAHWAPVINCLVRHKGKILLVRRSDKLNLYPGYWNGVSGFLDDDQSLQSKVREELREELGIEDRKVRSVVLGRIFHQHAPEYGKTWIVHPVLADVDTDSIKLDWEAQEYKWVEPKEVRKLSIIPGFEKVLEGVGL
jgi:isopentenyldiphosphate isomerase